jgi:hypothetical protein
VVFGRVSMRSPSGLRSFDPFRIAELEYQMWMAYYRRRWRNLLVASVGLLRLGFGTDLARIVPGAWLMLRAVRLWAPFPTTTRTVPRPACARSTWWSSSASASLRTRP